MPFLFCRKKSSPHTEQSFAPQPSVSEANTYQFIDETGKSAKRTTSNGAVATCTKEVDDNVYDNAVVDDTKHMYEVVNKFVDDLAKKTTARETVTVENDDDEGEIRKHTADDIIMRENDDIYVRCK